MVFWKSQSPWPALRGGFYDHYLETTGGFWGVRAAAGEAVHLQLNQTSRSLAVISRQFAALQHATATATYTDLRIGSPVGQPIRCEPRVIAANAVTDLGCEATWPEGHEGMLLLRLSLLVNDRAVSTNEYWLAPQGAVAEETAWAQFRAWKAVAKPVHVSAIAQVSNEDARTSANITLSAPVGGPAALGVRLQLGHRSGGSGDNRMLPAWFMANYITLLPGEQRLSSVDWDAGTDAASLEVRISGYNIVPLTVSIKDA